MLGFVHGPLSHPHHLGVQASVDVIDAIAAQVDVPADLAVLLLAGLDFPDEEEAYTAEAERRGWATEVVVGNDTFAVLRAGSASGWGVAVTCGSGMNCVGVGPDGRHVRFPALGQISGDAMDGGGAVGLAAAAVRGHCGPKSSNDRPGTPRTRSSLPVTTVEGSLAQAGEPRRSSRSGRGRRRRRSR